VVDETTVQDAAHFYRSFEHVDVAVDDPPADLEALDVRRGSDAIPALRERELTFADVMELSAPVDGVARELVGEFERCFDAAESILERDGPVPDRAAAVFLDLLTEEPDTFITKQHDEATAREATERARRARDGEIDPDTLAAAFVDEGINPGTTADLVAGALFVALERGLSV
jgi:triphosphoribosyl-dephospho-CoA synthase